MSAETRVEYILNPANGEVERRRVQSECLGSLDQFLAPYSEGRPVILPDVLNFREPSKRAGSHTGVYPSILKLRAANDSGKRSWACLLEAPTLKLNCGMFPFKDSGIEGTWGLTFNPEAPRQEAQTLWRPHLADPNLRLLFFIDSAVDLSRPWLLLFDPSTKSLYAPPLPNVYNDGRLCLGSGWENKPGLHQYLCGPFRAILESWAAFQEGTCNTDLWDSHKSDACSLLFRYNPKFEQVSAHPEWREGLKYAKVTFPQIEEILLDYLNLPRG